MPKTVKASFASKNFDIRPYTPADYRAWKSAYKACFPKQNEFDLEPKSPKELRRSEFLKFLRQNDKFRRDGIIYNFGVFEKRTGRLMGFVLLALVARFNVQSARITYTIFNNYWKRGYGREIAEATVGYAFRVLKLHRVEAEILPHNRASIALAKALKFQCEGIRRGAVYFNRKWHDHVIYAVLAEDLGLRPAKPSIFI
jgi:ribosomal-protein-alanine N-acetyltransferase